MIEVKIILHGAVTGCHKEIGRMYIANDGTVADPKRGDYDAYVCRKGSFAPPRDMGGQSTGRNASAARTGRVINYPRLSYNVWRLIARALKACFPEEA